MLDKKIFFKKMQLIAFSTHGDMYKSVHELNELYSFFKHYPDEIFSAGIDNLIRSEDSPYPPSIGKIIKYIDKVYFFNMSKEEFLSVLRTYKASGMPYKNKELNIILKQIDIDESIKSVNKENRITYKKEVKKLAKN